MCKAIHIKIGIADHMEAAKDIHCERSGEAEGPELIPVYEEAVRDMLQAVSDSGTDEIPTNGGQYIYRAFFDLGDGKYYDVADPDVVPDRVVSKIVSSYAEDGEEPELFVHVFFDSALDETEADEWCMDVSSELPYAFDAVFVGEGESFIVQGYDDGEHDAGSLSCPEIAEDLAADAESDAERYTSVEQAEAKAA